MCKGSKHFILLVGMFLCTSVLTAAQTPVRYVPYIVPAQERIARITAMVPTAARRPLAESLLRSENPEKFDAHFRYLSEAVFGRDQDQELEHLESHEHARHAERGAWPFRRWRFARLSSPPPNLSQ